jgi:hypothetical protein
MKKFHEWLRLNEAINAHSTHIEDLIFSQKAAGVKIVLDALKDIGESIGTAKGQGKVSTKIDGSPSLLWGYIGKKFFCSTKSAFNKTPKLNFTNKDIEKNHPGALADVLKIALECLKKITPTGRIFQGDFLFSKSTLKSMKVDGEDSWAWHPNTIVYSTPKNSPLGKKVGSAKMGIAVHTEYTHDGENFSVKGFGVPESAFKKSREVFLMDVNHKTIQDIKFTPVEAAKYWAGWNEIKSAAKLIPWNIISNDEISAALVAFVNSYIRNAQPYPDSKIMAQDFINYVREKYVDGAKSAPKKKEAEKLLKKITPNALKFAKVFDLFKAITEIKHILVNKLNSTKQIGTFVMKSDGSFEATGEEGFMITSGGASGVKLIQRMQFAANNFSKDIIKGFER